MIFLKETGISLTEHNQPKDVKRRTTERKLRSGVYWQGALKQKGIEQPRGTQSEELLPLKPENVVCQ